MNLSIILVTYALVIILDFIPLWKTGKRKQGYIYIGAFIVSFPILVLYSLNIDMPSITSVLKWIIDSFFQLF